MPIDRSRYPDNWKEIALAVKAAAGWRCEKCGIGHMQTGSIASCLTVHHPNRDPENPDAEKIALCTSCHLKAETQARRMEAERTNGQMRLFLR
jgi:hypothetical protein